MNKWLISNAKNIIITLMCVLLIYTGFRMYKNNAAMDALSASPNTSIVAEVNEKIKILESDSVATRSNLQGLNDLNTLVLDGVRKISDSLINSYRFDTSIEKLFNGKDSIYYNTDFLQYLHTETDHSLAPLKASSALYSDVISDPDMFLANYEEHISSNVSNFYRRLSISFYRIFINSPEDETRDVSYKLSKDAARNMVKIFSSSLFRSKLDQWRNQLLNITKEINSGITNLNTKLKQDFSDIQKLKDELKAMNDLSRDKFIINIALPVFSFLIIILFTIPYIYRNTTIGGNSANPSTVMSEIFTKGLLLKIFTVFLLTIAIILLAMGDKLKGETIGTLLGGISVYILQNSFGKPDQPQGGNNPNDVNR